MACSGVVHSVSIPSSVTYKHITIFKLCSSVIIIIIGEDYVANAALLRLLFHLSVCL